MRTDQDTEYEDIDEKRAELITAVQARQILYNVVSNSNRNKNLKETAWDEVAKEINKPESWCRAEWGKLREAYRKRKKTIIGKTGQARKKIESWCHFFPLQFLDEHDIISNTSGNLFVSVDVAEDEDNEPHSVLETLNEGSEPSVSGSQQKKDPTYSIKRNQRRPTIDPVDQEFLNYMKKPKEQLDEYHHFGMSIAQQLRDMKPEVAGLAKIRISEIMFQLQFPQLEVVADDQEQD